MNERKWMIYGANGFSAMLAIEESVKRGLKPVLAGRSPAIEKIAHEFNLDFQIFSLSSVNEVASQIKGLTVLANCAGPFSETAETMIQACIQAKVNYIDITGEISVYDYANQCDREAVSAGIVLCPGVGSDVIPTDCLAKYLKDECPDATDLKMGWHPIGSKASKGTAKTAAQGLFLGGKVRKDGKIKKVPLAYKEKVIDFGIGKFNTMTIPWGDVFTAYHSTGIPNIEFSLSRSPRSVKKIKRYRRFINLFNNKWFIKLLQNWIERNWKQPTAEIRKKGKSFFWGEVKDPKGKVVTARFSTGDGYNVTAVGVVVVAEYLLQHLSQKGYYTPSILMGKGLVKKMPGYSGIEIIKNE
ncbi:MAG: hypothetical protein CMG58_00665 [Candidatus Marinimicrobia bacterium]|nr:hypothetical protein [Candidatus Neomarinimicrobiota bacterium]